MSEEIKTEDIIESLRACASGNFDECGGCIMHYDLSCSGRLMNFAADQLEELNTFDTTQSAKLLAKLGMRENDRKIMHRAIDTYGRRAQCDVAIEEMAELTKALMKTRRVPDDDHAAQEHARSNVIEEIADVEIMIDQLKIMYGEHYVNAVREQKLVRLESRLNDAEKES